MTHTHAITTKKAWASRAGIGGVAAFALVVAGLGLQANASTNTYGTFHENDNAMPLSVTQGLVFSKNADLGVFVDPTWGKTTLTPSTPLSAVTSLSYTVDSSVSTSTPVAPVAYAPSYQLVVYADRNSQTQKYTRLVFEPYMQVPAQNASAGAYTNLQDGLWWTSKIDNPADGSQSKPMPLSFFEDGGASGWANVHIGAITIHQGSTTDVTSVVSDVTYNGTHLELGNADTTPFDQADIDAATSPLNAQISTLTSQNAALNTQVSTLEGQLATAQGQVVTLQGQLATAQGQLATAQGQLATAQSLLATAQGQLGDAQDDIAGLLDQVADLQTQVEGLEDQVADLEGQLGDSQDQVPDLQDQLADSQDQVADLEGQLADSQDQVSDLQGQLGDAQDNVADLEDQLADSQNQVSDLEGQLADAQDELADAVAAHSAEVADLNADIADLEGQLADAQDDVSDLEGQLADAQDDVSDLEGQLADVQDDLADAIAAHAIETAGLNAQITGLNTQVTSLTGQLTAAQSALTTYKSTHHTADGSSIGVSRAKLSTKPVHGKVVGVTLSGSIAKSATPVKYQWYVGGEPVVGATKATLKVPATATGKSVSVRVTGSYKNIVFAVHSNTLAAK